PARRRAAPTVRDHAPRSAARRTSGSGNGFDERRPLARSVCRPGIAGVLQADARRRRAEQRPSRLAHTVGRSLSKIALYLDATERSDVLPADRVGGFFRRFTTGCLAIHSLYQRER